MYKRQDEDHGGGQSGHIGVELAGSALGLGEDAGQTGGKTSQTACGQVVTGGDQTAGNAQSDDVADRDVLEPVSYTHLTKTIVALPPDACPPKKYRKFTILQNLTNEYDFSDGACVKRA